jgi:hypothetical protein
VTQRLLVGLLALAAVVCAQRRVAPEHLSERLLCVVPMVGAGTPEDPKRPLFAPWPATAETKSAILSYSQQVSDDGAYAIVEFVARDKAAFKAIASDARVKVIEREGRKDEDIEQELRRYKHDLTVGTGRLAQ